MRSHPGRLRRAFLGPDDKYPAAMCTYRWKLDSDPPKRLEHVSCILFISMRGWDSVLVGTGL